jgi:hypothetical protein
MVVIAQGRVARLEIADRLRVLQCLQALFDLLKPQRVETAGILRHGLCPPREDDPLLCPSGQPIAPAKPPLRARPDFG